MPLENRTAFAARLNQGLAAPNLLIGSVVVLANLRIGRTTETETEQPTTTGTTALTGCRAHTAATWSGTSITVGGAVQSPARPPYERSVTLNAADRRCELDVLGPRWWRKLGSDLVPSEPERFDEVELSFDNAFGGRQVLDPGTLPGSDIPTSGGTVVYGANPRGQGFHLSATTAADTLLPSIEWSYRRIRAWTDRPVPAGASPCSDLVALRVSDAASAPGRVNRVTLLESAIRAQHHAPGWLILHGVRAGCQIRLSGVGREAVAIELPSAPFVVRGKRPGRSAVALAPEFRAIHLDATDRVVTMIVGHNCSWPATAGSVSFTVEDT